jgi:HPt (histidine-containing phosphotransfer) domain-containing protein
VTSDARGAADDRAEAAMRQIAVRALKSNQERLVVLAEAVREAGHGGLDELQRSAAMDVAHQLVGSAGTFGYSRVSQLARRLEGFFRDADVSPSVVGAATEQIAVMQQDLRGEPDD